MSGRKPLPDLLDELLPAPGGQAAAAVPRAPVAGSGASRRVVVKIRQSVADQARAAVLFLQGHGHPTATLAGYVEEAVRARLECDRAALNGGAEFPPAINRLRPGRRIGG